MSDTAPAVQPASVTDVLEAIDVMCRATIPDLAATLSPDIDGMVQLLQLLRIAAAQMRWATEELEDEIAKVMPKKQVEVAGVGVVEMKTGAARKQWKNDEIVNVLVARIGDNPHVLCDPDSGEFLPPSEVVSLAIRSFLEVARPSWRTTALRGYRIDPDEYCETTWGRKTILTPKIQPWPDTEMGDN